MSKIKVADFYYGAVLSMLFSHKVTPALVESGEDRQVFDFTTNNKDFRLYVKYRAKENPVKKEDYSSWVFTLTADKIELEQQIKNNEHFFLALVCGAKDMGESHLALLDADQVKEILDRGKTTISVTIKKGERSFRIPIDNNREKGIKVKCNRFEELF